FDPDALLNPLESWAMDLDYVHNRTGIRTVRHVLSQFLPQVTFHRIDKKNGRLLFKTPDGIVPLQALSDGYQNIAAWVGDLLYRITEVFEDYRDPLNARGLLLIDEVDLHLHPNWQRELLAFLGRHLPNFQCIVTTHSPMTAQQAGQGHLHYLRREDGHLHIEPFTGTPSRLLVNQLLMSHAFGVASDESLDLQQKKDRYRQLRDQDALSANEEAELTALTTFLQERPSGGRANVQLHEAQVQLLQKIERELQEQSS
ncbi:MAG: AAA family ATPase, partial [Candidatus Tectomicrobia bacterium]